jgi:RimJ/RimL family protein N-acetyltransferase
MAKKTSITGTVKRKPQKAVVRGGFAPAPVRFDCERLYLQSPLSESHADLVATWFQDPDVSRFIAQPLPTREKVITAMRASKRTGGYFFGIFDKTDDRPIGYIEVTIFRRHKVAKTTTVIGDKAYWGNNYTLEARAGLLDFLFERTDVNKIASFIYARNLPSVFNNKALGYTCEGILRQAELGADGEFRDIMCFGLLREEWLAKKQAD